ncbi:MAG: hypothetical protein JRI68_12235 [Deltaproteobacteria bacterium]|nr:hypothetical protein [Deltaproteobacteria bacterium]
MKTLELCAGVVVVGGLWLGVSCSDDETSSTTTSGTGGSGNSSAGGAGGGASSTSSGTGGSGGMIIDAGPPPFPNGNIYVAGSRNAEVFEFDSNLSFVSKWHHTAFGTIEPAPGQPLSNGPAGMVFDESGYLVVAAVDQLCVFSAPDELLACHPKIASQPTENIIFDLAGNLYTTTSTGGTDEVHKYNSSYTHLETFTMPTGNLTGVTCDTSGDVYFASQLGGGSSAIYKVDGGDMSNVLDTIAITGTIEGLQMAADGNILVALGAGAGILRVQPSSPTVVVDSFTHASLFWAVPLTIDNAGNIYTADYETGSGSEPADLFVFDSTGTPIATALPSDIYGPFGMVVAGAVLPCGAYQPPR